MKEKSWMQTNSGKKVWINRPILESINLHDIAHALSMLCRFGGHTKHFYSVAEHSYHASFLVPDRLKFATLMHDASEAYLGDMIKPLKDSVYGEYSVLVSRFEYQINKYFGIYLSEDDHNIIKHADNKMLKVESIQAFNCPPVEGWSDKFPDDNSIKLEFYFPTRAYAKFINRYNELIKQ